MSYIYAKHVETKSVAKNAYENKFVKTWPKLAHPLSRTSDFHTTQNKPGGYLLSYVSKVVFPFQESEQPKLHW